MPMYEDKPFTNDKVIAQISRNQANFEYQGH